MTSFIIWVIVLILLGWVTFPILYLLFPRLADRGYGLSRPAGLLVFGYLYWILVTFRILPNNWIGVAAAYMLVMLLGILAIRKSGFTTVKNWIMDHHRFIGAMDIAFILLFAFFALVRAAYPEITGTEKPMELAFINSILRSPSFPPADPWLSGYAISYYYFGYIIVAGIIRLTGTISGVGFNLALALWFSMAAIGIYSLAFNILANVKFARDTKDDSEPKNRKAVFAIFAPVFLVFSANWEGLLELLHSTGMGWNSTGQSSFWKWLDVQELTEAPALLGWFPSRPGGIWWWRASRVLQDYDLAGNSKEIIDEFPFFSLYLADLHPHILSMPFVLLACTLALELFLQARSGFNFRISLSHVLKNWTNRTEPDPGYRASMMPAMQFWAGSLLLGGLSFLNTWDFPIGVGLTSAAIILGVYLSKGWSGTRILEFIESGLAFGITGGILYLPFYIGFASQAGGLLPSLAFFTRGVHLWLMFGVLLVPIFLGILNIFPVRDNQRLALKGLRKALSLVGILWAAMVLLGLLFAYIPGLIGSLNPSLADKLSDAAGYFFNVQGSANVRDVLLDTSVNRLALPGGWLTLLFLLTLVWGGVFHFRNQIQDEQISTDENPTHNQSVNNENSLPFTYLILAVGTGLVLFPEFFYLRDQFGWRMNTIFKFYYQAWILWSLAAAVCSYIFWVRSRGLWKWLGGTLFIISMVAGLIYPFYCLNDRFKGIETRTLTLDGNAYFSSGYPDETAAINYLIGAPQGIVAEAVGGSYTGYARVSTQSGQQTVLGWPGHESQWRGGAKEIGNRETEIRQLYQTNNWQEALEIIKKYDIRYIYIGMLERNTYRVNEAKFSLNLAPVFKNAGVIIYEVPSQLREKSTPK